MIHAQTNATGSFALAMLNRTKIQSTWILARSHGYVPRQSYVELVRALTAIPQVPETVHTLLIDFKPAM